jgi:hypothetical protein
MRRPYPSPHPSVSVEVDWFGALPQAHLHAFRKYAKGLESSYVMFSVSLEEAFGLLKSGSLTISLQAVSLAADFCTRLSESLENTLVSMENHSKEYGTIPSVAPLNPADFHSRRGQRSARRSCLLSRLQLSRHAQFLRKIHALKGIVSNCRSDFRRAAVDLASLGYSAGSSAWLWDSLDAGHFDLNTCLREAIVLLKCFLRVLPSEQLIRFERTASMRNPGLPVPVRDLAAVWRWTPIPRL